MTKKIRIAVACDYLGNYNAAGWGGPNLDSPDAEARWTSAAMEGLEPSGLDGLVWVEAEIPLPAEQTVAGTAVLEPAAEAQPADRLEEAALASLPFGSGELAQALSEANAVRRGDVPEGRRQDLIAGLEGHPPYGVTEDLWKETLRDARIARAAEAFVASQRDLTKPGMEEAWDALLKAVEGEGHRGVESPVWYCEKCDRWQDRRSPCEADARFDERARIWQMALNRVSRLEEHATNAESIKEEAHYHCLAEQMQRFADLLAPECATYEGEGDVTEDYARLAPEGGAE